MDEKSLSFLQEKLSATYSAQEYAAILDGFSRQKKTALRANALKCTAAEICDLLKKEGIPFSPLPYYSDGFVLPENSEERISALPVYDEGKIYLQNPSSMLPPLLFSPDIGKTVLDMAAAPGGKTCLLSALTDGSSSVTACEANARRAERLRYNLKKQGVGRVTVTVLDARKLDDWFRFDSVLLDAPWSGSGTVSPTSCERASFSQENLKKTARLQAELLKKGVKLLKKGGTLVYSTCSLFKEENEEIVRQVLKTGECSLLPLDENIVNALPRLSSSIDGVLTVLPTDIYEGFFVAKLKKN